MRDIGALISACWAIRSGAKWARVPDGSYGILLKLEDAERIHAELVSVSPGADQVEVAFTYGMGEQFDIQRTTVDKPPAPVAGEEWFRVFDIPVVVLGC